MKSSFIDSSLAPEFILLEPLSKLVCGFTSVSPTRRILGLDQEAEDICAPEPTIFTNLRKYENIQKITKSERFNCSSYVNSVFHWKTLGERVLSDSEIVTEYEKLREELIESLSNSTLYKDIAFNPDTKNRCFNATKKETRLLSQPKAIINSDGSFSFRSNLIVDSPGEKVLYLLVRAGLPASQISNSNMINFLGEALNVYPIFLKADCECKANEYISQAGLCVSCPNGCSECNNDNTCLKCTSEREPVNGRCFCLSNQYLNSLDGSCNVCNAKCKSCSGPSENECLTCPDGKSAQNGLCWCEAGKVLTKGQCIGR